MTFDSDIPKLRDTLKSLQDGVRDGAFTPEVANEILGKVADGLIEQRKPKEKKK
jgi:hypothetical protein